MSWIVALVSLALMLGGAVFLFAAALGVLRFSDPLQRMHASTKAGTLGAILTVAGAMVALGRVDVSLIGLAAIGFLMLTVPVAGHLLGRAVYVSGERLEGIEGRDALEGVLAREEGEGDAGRSLPQAGGLVADAALDSGNKSRNDGGSEGG